MTYIILIKEHPFKYNEHGYVIEQFVFDVQDQRVLDQQNGYPGAKRGRAPDCKALTASPQSALRSHLRLSPQRLGGSAGTEPRARNWVAVGCFRAIELRR